MIELQDIRNVVQDKVNMGGIWQDIYFAPKDDFAEFATIPKETDNREYSTMNKLVVGKDRLKPGKRLYSIYCTLEKGGLTAERQGEVDGMSHKVILKMFTPGLQSESLAMLLIPNMNWVFYVRTGEQMFRVGGPQFAAKMSPEGSVGTGETTSTLKGNEFTFTTYEGGYAPEVVDIEYILSMVHSVDESLGVTFTPLHSSTGVTLSTKPTISFSKNVINSSTMQPFTSQEAESIVSLQSLDFEGKVIANIPFTAAIATNKITVNPSSNFSQSTLYKLSFDATKVLSASAQGRVNGSNEIRFITASS